MAASGFSQFKDTRVQTFPYDVHKEVMYEGFISYIWPLPETTSIGHLLPTQVPENRVKVGVNLGARGGVNGSCYAYLIQEVVPIVKAKYNNPQFKEIWQDDCAVIHR